MHSYEHEINTEDIRSINLNSYPLSLIYLEKQL